MRPGQAVTGSVVFFFVTPGVVAGLLPWLIGRASEGAASWPMRSLGLLVGLVGLIALVACFADFVVARGTPAPVAPTERLVVEGLYRYVRNPMYVAVVTIILGQALWHASWWVLAYGFLVWGATAAFARFHEEPVLRNRFGPEYESYRRAVRAWIPRARPWSASEEPGSPA